MKSLSKLIEADEFDERQEDRLAQFVGCALSGICVSYNVSTQPEDIASRAWAIGNAMYNKFNEELYSERQQPEDVGGHT
jgi:hypothetical protein